MVVCVCKILMALEKTIAFMNKYFDKNLFSVFIDSFSGMLDIELEYMHLKYKNYQSIVKLLDLYEPKFQKCYKNFIDQNLRDKTNSYRLVYSKQPTIICSLPGNFLYHLVKHPIVPNSHSVFCSFTMWTDTNTIISQNTKEIAPVNSDMGSYCLLSDDDKLIFPDNINNTNNSSIGIFFNIMSYNNYKTQTSLSTNETIGKVFGLL